MVEKYSLFVCSETECGGESIATKYFLKELRQHTSWTEITEYWHPALTTSGSIPFFLWILKSIFFFLRKTFKQRKIDYFYTTTYTAGVVGALLKTLFGFKLVFHYHGSRLPDKPNKNHHGITLITQQIKYKCVWLLHHYVFTFTDLIIIPSRETQNELKKLSDNRHFAVVENGVDLEKFYPITQKQKMDLRKQYSIQKNTKVILFIGRMDREKNVEKVLTVYQRLLESETNILLVIAFPKKTDYYSQLLRKTSSMQLGDHVLFMENRFPQELYWLSDLVVSFSKKETLPMVMLEALACDRLFLSTHASTKPILEAISPILYELNSTPIAHLARSIRTLLNLPIDEQKDMSKKTGILIQKFSWQKKAKALTKNLLTLR